MWLALGYFYIGRLLRHSPRRCFLYGLNPPQPMGNHVICVFSLWGRKRNFNIWHSDFNIIYFVINNVWVCVKYIHSRAAYPQVHTSGEDGVFVSLYCACTMHIYIQCIRMSVYTIIFLLVILTREPLLGGCIFWDLLFVSVCDEGIRWSRMGIVSAEQPRCCQDSSEGQARESGHWHTSEVCVVCYPCLVGCLSSVPPWSYSQAWFRLFPFIFMLVPAVY